MGAASIPFVGATFCLQLPVKRSTIRFTGGTAGQCSGSFSLLVNTGDLFPPPLPGGFDAGPGGTSWYQAWYRDPELQDGFDSVVSDAICVEWI